VTVEHEWAAERHGSEPVAEAAVESRRAEAAVEGRRPEAAVKSRRPEAAVEPAEAAVEAAESAMMEPAPPNGRADASCGAITRPTARAAAAKLKNFFMGTPP
jgi:hypothetical protein